MSTSGIPRIWDLIEEALATPGASKIHLTVGRPPLVRISDSGLQPFANEHPVLTWKTIQAMLCTIVEPERWESIEQMGEGELRISDGSGRPITISIFRNSGAWSAVVHL